MCISAFWTFHLHRIGTLCGPSCLTSIVWCFQDTNCYHVPLFSFLSWSDMSPSHGCIVFCLSLQPLIALWGVPAFMAIVGSANLSIHVQVLYENVSSHLSRYLSHMVTLRFTFEELRQVFHSVWAPLHSLTSPCLYKFSPFLYSFCF